MLALKFSSLEVRGQARYMKRRGPLILRNRGLRTELRHQDKEAYKVSRSTSDMFLSLSHKLLAEPSVDRVVQAGWRMDVMYMTGTDSRNREHSLAACLCSWIMPGNQGTVLLGFIRRRLCRGLRLGSA